MWFSLKFFPRTNLKLLCHGWAFACLFFREQKKLCQDENNLIEEPKTPKVMILSGAPFFLNMLVSLSCCLVCHAHVRPSQGWAGMTFGDLGTGTGMAQPIPKLWEREREWKISFPTFGNGNGKIPFPIFGNGNGNSIPAFREREWDVVIPVNDREWERELHRKIEWKFFIIPLFNPTNILHCNRPQICS